MAVQVFHVGVTAFRDKSVTLRQWQPTMDFLSTHVPDARFEVVPLVLSEFENELKNQKLDFLITNPQQYIAVEVKYGVSRIATLVTSQNGVVMNRIGSVIFARADRTNITDLKQIRGLRIAATDKSSFAAFLIPQDMLLDQGVDLLRDCQTMFLGFPQDLSVQAVLDGHADVGFARTGLLEAMASEGKLDLAKLRIINPQSYPNFPFLVSTALYPEWPLAAAPHVPIDITNQVVAALLLMPPDSIAAKSGRYYRWSTPLEYQSVQNFMRRRHIYPFDQPEPVLLSTLLREYALTIVGGALVIVLAITLLYWRSSRLNLELVQSRKALSDMAHHDALTGLPNRNLLFDRLEQALARAKRSGTPLALCMLDLDGFKPVNDSYGHEIGDRVLMDIAARIKNTLRVGDTVARFGGDEFVVLLDGFEGETVLKEIVIRIIAAVAERFEYCEQAQLSASIGISVFNQDTQDANQLLRNADESMYLAKRAGGNRFVIHLNDHRAGQV